MANEKLKIRSKIRLYKLEEGLLGVIPCTEEESKEYKKLIESGQSLPEGVYQEESKGENEYEFYTIYDPELTEREMDEYFALKHLKLLNTIKNCVMFFTVLTIISLVILLLLFVSGM